MTACLLKMEVTQTMQPLSAPIEEVLATPPGAAVNVLCRSWRRPFGTYMQPKPGHGSNNYDVVLRGRVEADGKVHEAVVQDSERPDLNPEALSMAQQWTFTPEVCEGHPNPKKCKSPSTSSHDDVLRVKQSKLMFRPATLQFTLATDLDGDI